MTELGLGVGAVVAEGIADAEAADAMVDAEDADGAVTAEGAGDAELAQPTRHIPKRPASNRESRRMSVTTDDRPFAGRGHSTAAHRGPYTDAVSLTSAPVGPDRLAPTRDREPGTGASREDPEERQGRRRCRLAVVVVVVLRPLTR